MTRRTHAPADTWMPSLLAIGGMRRRHFLQAAALLAATPAAYAASPMKFVGETESRVFRKLLDVMLPVDNSGLVPPSRIPVLETLDAALLATMEPHVLQGLRAGIGYWNDGPRPLYGRAFVDLEPDQATRFCDRWSDGAEVPQRALSTGLKKLVSLAYFANPPTWAPLGYGGPTTRARNIPSLGNAPLPTASRNTKDQ